MCVKVRDGIPFAVFGIMILKYKDKVYRKVIVHNPVIFNKNSRNRR